MSYYGRSGGGGGGGRDDDRRRDDSGRGPPRDRDRDRDVYGGGGRNDDRDRRGGERGGQGTCMLCSIMYVDSESLFYLIRYTTSIQLEAFHVM